MCEIQSFSTGDMSDVTHTVAQLLFVNADFILKRVCVFVIYSSDVPDVPCLVPGFSNCHEPNRLVEVLLTVA